MTHCFRHPKFYKELKKLQTQATSEEKNKNKLQATSNKKSYKLQASRSEPSSKRSI